MTYTESNPRYAFTFSPVGDSAIEHVRRFHAPADLVFRAMTDPARAAEWRRPRLHHPRQVETWEPRTGGKWKAVAPDDKGGQQVFFGEFVEVVPDEKIVRTFSVDGAPGPALVESFELATDGDDTVLTMRTTFGSQQMRDGVLASPMEAFARQSCELLEELLARETTPNAFVIKRRFAAPRERVFDAWINRELAGRWFGPTGSQVEYAHFDVRAGGFVDATIHSPGMPTVRGKFFYREITAPSRIIYTQIFLDDHGAVGRHPLMPTWPAELLTTVNFSADGDATVIELEWRPLRATPEEIDTFDGAFDGMQGGWGGSFDALDEVLKTQKNL